MFEINAIFTACLCEGLTKQFIGWEGVQSYPVWKVNFIISVRVHSEVKAVLG